MKFYNYKIWFKGAIIFQLLTALFHSLSFISPIEPSNETEKQLLDLMNAYHINAGAGFTPTMNNLMTSFSIAFTLLLLFGGLLNLYLLRKNLDTTILRGVVGINVFIFGSCFVAMLFLTFLIPIICVGLIFVSLALTYFTIPKS